MTAEGMVNVCFPCACFALEPLNGAETSQPIGVERLLKRRLRSSRLLSTTYDFCLSLLTTIGMPGKIRCFCEPRITLTAQVLIR